MGPFDGAFGLGYSTRDFIEEVWGWDGAVERGYEVCWESVEGLAG